MQINARLMFKKGHTISKLRDWSNYPQSNTGHPTPRQTTRILCVSPHCGKTSDNSAVTPQGPTCNAQEIR